MIRSSELKEFKELDLLFYRNVSNEENVMNSQKYVILLQCGDFSDKCNNEKKAFTPDEINLIKKILPNQIRQQGKKHHGSIGKIYSYGYVAKYEKMNHTSLSFGKYVSNLDGN